MDLFDLGEPYALPWSKSIKEPCCDQGTIVANRQIDFRGISRKNLSQVAFLVPKRQESVRREPRGFDRNSRQMLGFSPMPILEVEIVGHPGKHGLSQALADAAAEVLRTEPQRTWVKLRHLAVDQYAENGATSNTAKPVFVSLLLGSRPEIQEMARVASALSAAFAKVLDRPAENIHVLFEPGAVGRIAFGGQLK